MYTFAKLNASTRLEGWWLKLTTIEQLTEYLAASNQRYAEAALNYLANKIKHPNAANLTIQAYLQACNHDENIIQALLELEGQTALTKADYIANYGQIYVNENHGWQYAVSQNQISETCQRTSLVWPK